jgi:hypothetical protein
MSEPQERVKQAAGPERPLTAMHPLEEGRRITANNRTPLLSPCGGRSQHDYSIRDERKLLTSKRARGEHGYLQL